MRNNTQNKLVKSVLWNSLEKFFVKGTSFIISIVLARILTPEDYGLIGMLTVFIALSTIFIESGFAKALIQKQERTEVDFSTVFYFNLLIAVVIYIILYASAPYVSSFYDAPILCPILRVLSLNIIVGSVNIVQRAKLMILMDFKVLAKINFLGTLLGGLGGITMAYAGVGVWALVGQTLITTITMAFLFFYFTKWTPLWSFSVASFKQLFRFGSRLLIAGSVATIFNNITTIAIGKIYKSNQLGFYTRASQFTEMIAWTINDILGTVTFPVLSELQNDREHMLLVYKKSLFYTSLIIFPIMILLAVLAQPLVVILLTDKWLPSVVLMQILCFARMLTPLSAINMNLLNAIGRSDLYMKIDLSKLPLETIILIITIPMGIKAIVIGNLISTIICFFINAYYPGNFFNYGGWSQLKDTSKIFIALIIMASGAYIVIQMLDSPLLQLLLGGGIGLILYVICCSILKLINIKYVFQRIKRRLS